MGIFNFKRKHQTVAAGSGNQNGQNLATIVLNNISEGVVTIDGHGLIKLLNPAAATMAGFERPDIAIGLDYTSVIRLQSQQGKPFTAEENPLVIAVKQNEPFSSRKLLLVASDNQRQVAIHLNMIPTGGPADDKIITFRDITKELADENEQAEFISTASHEMRTPVAAIEGYLGLALSPQTATIDDRARQYLTEAHTASQHLGALFKDLLDVTKLDDGRLQPHPVPIEVTATVKGLADEYADNIAAKHLTYNFGTADATGPKLDQLVYASLDVSFLREIMDNLIGNAVKYTPEGGNIWVNVRGDGDKVLINVTDSGIGISADDLTHVFQKFYRVDNSQTRQIGGTGLGLYLVKQRVETMGGRVWAESVFGEGSTFYVSFPRLNESEYQRLKLATENSRMVQGFTEGAPVAAPTGAAATGAATTTGAVPVSAALPAQPTTPVASQPVAAALQPGTTTPKPAAATTQPAAVTPPVTASATQQSATSPQPGATAQPAPAQPATPPATAPQPASSASQPATQPTSTATTPQVPPQVPPQAPPASP